MTTCSELINIDEIKCSPAGTYDPIIEKLTIDENGFLVGPLKDSNISIVAICLPNEFDFFCEKFKLKRKHFFWRGNIKYVKAKQFTTACAC